MPWLPGRRRGIRARTEELFVLPPGLVVYQQPQMFTSATGHGHPDVEPSPGCTRAPQVLAELCCEGGALLGRKGSRDEG